jgi:dolichyl-phosphate beta-glucosyltransferase
MKTKLSISIVIPAYNEEKRIGKSLRNIISYCTRHFTRYEIIVVDDGSADKTSEVVASFRHPHVRILKNRKNWGKGYSVRRGMLAATYPLVLFTDSDLATPFEEITKLIRGVEDGHDVVIASRNMKGSRIMVKQPWHRQLLGKTFPLLVRIVAVSGFKDTQCGFKLFTKKAAQDIFRRQTFERFSFDVETLFIAKKRGYAIKEVPVIWIDKEGSKVDPMRDSMRMLKDIFTVRVNNLKGRYK